VTIGAVRNQLEKRLELDVGTLLHKPLRKKVRQVMQHEVIKKLHRRQDIEQIIKVLIEFSEYPVYAKQMLIESIPYAAAQAPGGRHAHQEQILNMVREVLDKARDKALLAQEEGMRQVQSAIEELKSHQAARDEAVAAEACSRRRAADVVALLQKAAEELAGMEEKIQTATKSMCPIEEKSVQWKQMRSAATTLCDGHLKVLVEGNWQHKDELDSALAAVNAYLVSIDTGTTLLKAALAALAIKPTQRGTFDNLAISSLQSSLAEKVAEFDRMVATNAEALEEVSATLQVETALHQVAQNRQAQLQRELQDIEAEVQERVACHQGAETNALEKQEALQRSQTAHSSLGANVQECTRALTLLMQLENQGCDGESPAAHVGMLEGADNERATEVTDSERTQDSPVSLFTMAGA